MPYLAQLTKPKTKGCTCSSIPLRNFPCLIDPPYSSSCSALRAALLLSALCCFFPLGFGSLTLCFSFISASDRCLRRETLLASSFYYFLRSFSFSLNFLLSFFLRDFFSFFCLIFRENLSFFFCSACEREKIK